tara:strand:+ start:317 stop:463 length:147 start_codon:yes stop_codon:yes gene_type:complete
MDIEEFEKMCRHYYKIGDEEWIITTLLQYHEYLSWAKHDISFDKLEDE